MRNDIFFSVIIATYNRAHLLARAVDSVLVQRSSEFELLIIDDGSTDNTEEIVQRYNDQRIRYKKIQNSERGAARNVGIAASYGKYVTFLDSDDYLQSEHLEVVRARLNELNFPEVFHQAYVIRDSSGTVLQRPARHRDVGKALFTKGNILSCMGVFVRRDIMRLNLFNEDRLLAGLEDWELWIRLAAQYYIHSDKRITGVLFQHKGRSSVHVDRAKLETKCKLFVHLVAGNGDVQMKYGVLIKSLIANVYTFLSLHLSESPFEKKAGWLYLVRGIITDKNQVFKRRSFAILRNLLWV